MNFWNRLRTFEPVQLAAILSALAIVGTAVGLDLSDVFGRINTSYAALFAIFPIIQGLVTRPAVTPNAKVVETREPDGTHLAGEASPAPTGTEL